MVTSLALLLAAQTSGPGAIPRLAPDELAVVSEGGGQLAYVGRLSILRDGTVVYVSSIRQDPPKRVSWLLTRQELAAFQTLLTRANFAALYRAPHPKFPPSAYDGIERGLAVRQGYAVRGWSNALWTQPTRPVPLFDRLDEMIGHARELGLVQN